MDIIESRELGERDGFTLVAYKVPDTDTTPHDADCYSEADVEAWRRDEWRYVGVIVKAFREGIELGESSLWGTEDGTMPFPTVPNDFPVKQLDADDKNPNAVTDNTCGARWDDSISTAYTPAPAGRCPFEAFHGTEVDAFGHTLGEHEHDYDVPGDALNAARATLARLCGATS